jgi:hypothetical protein
LPQFARLTVTGDRVEAAARAMSFDSPVWDEYLTAAELALAAADEADRVAGVVRVDTNDAATVERVRAIDADDEPCPTHVDSARRVLAALAAAGAPEETHD